ncbi:MAG: hypothetical protein LBI39_03830 [Puniceicoccales bacterium]|jgi:hypothetical protein|nr:hypothetical protein [Puniceicoccales bacterium]
MSEMNSVETIKTVGLFDSAGAALWRIGKSKVLDLCETYSELNDFGWGEFAKNGCPNGHLFAIIIFTIFTAGFFWIAVAIYVALKRRDLQSPIVILLSCRDELRESAEDVNPSGGENVHSRRRMSRKQAVESSGPNAGVIGASGFVQSSVAGSARRSRRAGAVPPPSQSSSSIPTQPSMSSGAPPTLSTANLGAGSNPSHSAITAPFPSLAPTSGGGSGNSSSTSAPPLSPVAVVNPVIGSKKLPTKGANPPCGGSKVHGPGGKLDGSEPAVESPGSDATAINASAASKTNVAGSAGGQAGAVPPPPSPSSPSGPPKPQPPTAPGAPSPLSTANLGAGPNPPNSAATVPPPPLAPTSGGRSGNSSSISASAPPLPPVAVVNPVIGSKKLPAKGAPDAVVTKPDKAAKVAPAATPIDFEKVLAQQGFVAIECTSSEKKKGSVFANVLFQISGKCQFASEENCDEERKATARFALYYILGEIEKIPDDQLAKHTKEIMAIMFDKFTAGEDKIKIDKALLGLLEKENEALPCNCDANSEEFKSHVQLRVIINRAITDMDTAEVVSGAGNLTIGLYSLFSIIVNLNGDAFSTKKLTALQAMLFRPQCKRVNPLCGCVLHFSSEILHDSPDSLADAYMTAIRRKHDVLALYHSSKGADAEVLIFREDGSIDFDPFNAPMDNPIVLRYEAGRFSSVVRASKIPQALPQTLVSTSAQIPTAIDAVTQASVMTQNPAGTPPQPDPSTATAPSSSAVKTHQSPTATLSSSAEPIGDADEHPAEKPQIWDDQTIFADMPQDLRDIATIPMNYDEIIYGQIREAALLLFKPIANWGCDPIFTTPGNILIYALDDPNRTDASAAYIKNGGLGFLSHRCLIISSPLRQIPPVDMAVELELDQKDGGKIVPKNVDGAALLKKAGVETEELFTFFPQLQFREDVDFSNQASVDAWNHLVLLVRSRKNTRESLHKFHRSSSFSIANSGAISGEQLSILGQEFRTKLTKSLTDHAILDGKSSDTPNKCTPFGEILRLALDTNTACLKESCAEYFWETHAAIRVRNYICLHLMRCIILRKSDLPLDAQAGTITIVKPNAHPGMMNEWESFFGMSLLSYAEKIRLIESGAGNLREFFAQVLIAAQAVAKQVADEFIANIENVRTSIAVALELFNGSTPRFPHTAICSEAAVVKSWYAISIDYEVLLVQQGFTAIECNSSKKIKGSVFANVLFQISGSHQFASEEDCAKECKDNARFSLNYILNEIGKIPVTQLSNHTKEIMRIMIGKFAAGEGGIEIDEALLGLLEMEKTAWSRGRAIGPAECQLSTVIRKARTAIDAAAAIPGEEKFKANLYELFSAIVNLNDKAFSIKKLATIQAMLPNYQHGDLSPLCDCVLHFSSEILHGSSGSIADAHMAAIRHKRDILLFCHDSKRAGAELLIHRSNGFIDSCPPAEPVFDESILLRCEAGRFASIVRASKIPPALMEILERDDW